ncbi:hypothetical protein EVAR_90063_1 [Eumeta japonica]|uniref:Uncharacterized protein n=1 Tax=Eumeta variegata TaxID=151549 RepID=A0A4C1WTQ8_EUMVA|nr:hypothetical protein EVAR_90063_1 [Eumeta japonica]
MSLPAAKEQVVIPRSHQCDAALLDRNRISDGEEIEVVEVERYRRCGRVLLSNQSPLCKVNLPGAYPTERFKRIQPPAPPHLPT